MIYSITNKHCYYYEIGNLKCSTHLGIVAILYHLLTCGFPFDIIIIPYTPPEGFLSPRIFAAVTWSPQITKIIELNDFFSLQGYVQDISLKLLENSQTILLTCLIIHMKLFSAIEFQSLYRKLCRVPLTKCWMDIKKKCISLHILRSHVIHELMLLDRERTLTITTYSDNTRQYWHWTTGQVHA